jgi:hypothetical protein
MEGLTPASADDLPPLGDLVTDDPFWRYPAGGAGREGVAHLRVWLTAGREARHLAVVTETGAAASVTGSAGHIWTVLAGRYGCLSCCSNATSRPSSTRAWRLSIWSASARTAAHGGPGCGRRRRTFLVTPGWNCGWPTAVPDRRQALARSRSPALWRGPLARG